MGREYNILHLNPLICSLKELAVLFWNGGHPRLGSDSNLGSLEGDRKGLELFWHCRDPSTHSEFVKIPV